MSLDESGFAALADALLEAILEAVEEVYEDADADIHAGILTISLAAGGQYVINKHAPNREIWLSSPKSGATHFKWANEEWVSTRDGSVKLVPLLTAELGIRL
jgi:frataxin